MTKYVGRHRARRAWTKKKTISSSLIAAGILSFPTTGHADNDKPPMSPPTRRLAPAVETPVFVPHEPPRDGNGQAEFNAWVEAGKPGYIPDPHTAKGERPELASVSEPEVVQPVCDKPDLAGLTPHALEAYHTICALFPQITTFYGFRTGDQDHGTGNAVDSMVYNDAATGDALAQFLVDNAEALNVKYIIWQQRIWMPGGTWQWMEDRGSPTQNHMDHVHLSVN